MITSIEFIDKPYSGEYKERIYDNENPWNSSDWTFVKFTEENYDEWCGQFRGAPIKLAISNIDQTILILTSDYLFSIDSKFGNLINMKERTGYINLTAIPNGDFLVSDYYNIEKISSDLLKLTNIKSPIPMDMIKFKNWNDEFLNILCDEFINWENKDVELLFNSKSNILEILKK